MGSEFPWLGGVSPHPDECCSVEPVCAWDTLTMPKIMKLANTIARAIVFFRMEAGFMIIPLVLVLKIDDEILRPSPRFFHTSLNGSPGMHNLIIRGR